MTTTATLTRIRPLLALLVTLCLSAPTLAALPTLPGAPALATDDDPARALPRLERMLVSARALYECGEDDNLIAAVVVPFDGLPRSLSLHPVALGPNGVELGAVLARTVFHSVGVHTSHLGRDMQRRVVAAFLRVLWAMDESDLRFVEVGDEFGGSLPGADADGASASTALGVIDGGRILIMRGVLGTR